MSKLKPLFSNLTQAQAMLLVGLITVILGGILTGYVQLRQTQIPIEATQTAETKLATEAIFASTQTAEALLVSIPTATSTPTPMPILTTSNIPISSTETPRPVDHSIPGIILFEDDFEDGKAENWSEHQPEQWSVIEDENGNFVYQGDATTGWTFTFPRNPPTDWQNYSVEIQWRIIQNGEPDGGTEGMVDIRGYFEEARDCYRFYGAYFNSASDYVSIGRQGTKHDCNFVTLIGDTYDIEPGQWYTIRFTANNTTFSVDVDDYTLLEVQDGEFTNGKFELNVTTGAIVQYDNVRVIALGQ